MLAIGSISGMAVGSRAQAETEYTPSVSLAQRYDSNVFFTAKQFVPQGRQSWDLVTAVKTNLEILNKSRLADTSVRAGVDGNVYAYNSYLSYGSANVLAKSDLTDWAKELLPGLKLRISDAFQYTPQRPAFPIAVQATQSDVFSSGLQGGRANSYSNSLSTEGEYSFSRTAGLRANYSYSILHIGRLFVPQTGGNSTAFNFFDTTLHNVSTGPTYTLDGGDTLFLKFGYLSSDQSNTLGRSPSIKFAARSIQPEYVSRIVRGWTATISGVATQIEQAGNKTFFSGSFFLANELDRQTLVSVGVSRQAAPLYIGIGGAMISNVVQLSVSHSFSRLVKLTVIGSYAYNESTPVKAFTSKIYNTSAVLDYRLTKSTKLS